MLHHNSTTITPKAQHANISYDSNSCFANYMNSHIGVASHDNGRYVASTNTYVDNGPHLIYHNSGYHVQEPMSTMNSSSLIATSNT